MKAAYIGILTPGTTSRMRAEWLRELTPEAEWLWIDTDAPFRASHRVWRSLAFRTMRGAAVDAVNRTVRESLREPDRLDLVWVDKGVFLRPDTMEIVRRCAGKLVHFTPDTAFHANRSAHFEKSLSQYDLVVTTKSFEMKDYLARIRQDALHLTTQGFDPQVHFPRGANEERARSAVFIGLAEPDRERCMDALLDAGVTVRLGGRGWRRYVRRRAGSTGLEFLGEQIFGDAYAEAYSRAWVGLGLLSKRFPELHTTRTFEIPACGAILASERTADTGHYFSENDVIFFQNHTALAARLLEFFHSMDNEMLVTQATAGRRRVLDSCRDYPGILSKILTHPQLVHSEAGLMQRTDPAGAFEM